MLMNATIVTNSKRCGVYDTDSRTIAFDGLKEREQSKQATWHQFDKSVVARHIGKLTLEQPFDMKGIEHFELSISELMEEHKDGHQLRQGGLSLTFSGIGTLLDELLMEDGLKLFAKGVVSENGKNRTLRSR
jgi:hypothetical protein